MFVLNAIIEWTETDTMFFNFKVITVTTEIAHEDKSLTTQPFSGNNPRCSTPSGLRGIYIAAKSMEPSDSKKTLSNLAHIFLH